MIVPPKDPAPQPSDELSEALFGAEDKTSETCRAKFDNFKGFHPPLPPQTYRMVSGIPAVGTLPTVGTPTVAQQTAPKQTAKASTAKGFAPDDPYHGLGDPKCGYLHSESFRKLYQQDWPGRPTPDFDEAVRLSQVLTSHIRAPSTKDQVAAGQMIMTLLASIDPDFIKDSD